MRKLLLPAVGLLALSGCYHTTVAPLPEGEHLVSFVNDAPPPFAFTSPIFAEDVALWRAADVCPTGFKVTHEALDLGSFPHSYNIVILCKVPITALNAPVPPPMVEPAPPAPSAPPAPLTR
jgi:hypothetical protein